MPISIPFLSRLPKPHPIIETFVLAPIGPAGAQEGLSDSSRAIPDHLRIPGNSQFLTLASLPEGINGLLIRRPSLWNLFFLGHSRIEKEERLISKEPRIEVENDLYIINKSWISVATTSIVSSNVRRPFFYFWALTSSSSVSLGLGVSSESSSTCSWTLRSDLGTRASQNKNMQRMMLIAM